MNELIPITEKDGIETVNARELYEFLEVGRDFSSWIKQRIGKYDFIETQDYITEKTTPQKGGMVKTIYYTSIDMAKELSMVENNNQGKKARRYFIEVEKQIKQLKLPKTYGEALLEAGRLAVENEQLQLENAIMKPKAELADAAIRDESKHYCITDAGKLLGVNQTRIFRILRSNYLLTSKRLPTQKALNEEVLDIRNNVRDGKNYPQAIMTMKNIDNFRKMYLSREKKNDN